VRVSIHFDNDDDQKKRAWIFVMIWSAVILFELTLIAVLVTYTVLVVDLPL